MLYTNLMFNATWFPHLKTSKSFSLFFPFFLSLFTKQLCAAQFVPHHWRGLLNEWFQNDPFFFFFLQYVEYLEKKFLWCAYWVGLGILSSVGLGTGLHTFLLYLVRKTEIKHTQKYKAFKIWWNRVFFFYFLLFVQAYWQNEVLLLINFSP